MISDFVLCFGQIFILYVLLPRQDAVSAERAAKAFCWSLLVTSVYALVFRNAPQLVALRGVEDIAICRLTASDVVRHALVQKIVAAYDQYEKTRLPAMEAPKKFKRK